jgi:hypothetical protein
VRFRERPVDLPAGGDGGEEGVRSDISPGAPWTAYAGAWSYPPEAGPAGG